jgi:hypothetical protein
MAVGEDVGAGLDGVEKPVAAEFVVRVEIQVLAQTRINLRLGG